MILPTTLQPMTLDQFADWYPDGRGRFELHDGEIIPMQPTGSHESIAGELAGELFAEIRRLKLSFLIPRQCLIKVLNSNESAFSPDVAILDKGSLENEPLWLRRSTITKGSTIPLVIEVVSTNWQDDDSIFEFNRRQDSQAQPFGTGTFEGGNSTSSERETLYVIKLSAYEQLGIQEYWIVDYLGLGGQIYIGSPKQPTISIYQLVAGEYIVEQFRGEQRLRSGIFTELSLTATQIMSIPI